MVRRASIAAVALVLGACTSFGAPSDAPSPDGGAAVDGDAAVDGGGGEAEAGRGASYCASLSAPAAMCADFDDGVIPTSPWTLVEQGGATAKLIEDCGPSDTRSIRCIELAGAQHLVPIGDVGSALRRKVGGVSRGFVVSFAVRVVQLAAGRFDLLSVALRKPTGERWILEVEVDATNKLDLAEYTIDGGGAIELSRATATKPLEFAEWYRVDVALAVDAAANASTAEVRLDGDAVAKASVSAHGFEAFDWIDVGDAQLDGSVAVRARFDDVLLAISP